MVNRRDVFQAISDPTRRAILNLISANGTMNPGGIAEKFETSRQTISNHIQILVECELLNSEIKGREIIYKFNPEKMKELDDFLVPFRKQWETHFEKMDQILKTL
jgi:DNA-binding transcriptional ArsR family regulator